MSFLLAVTVALQIVPSTEEKLLSTVPSDVSVFPSDFRFSADGSAVVYTANLGGKTIILRNNEKVSGDFERASLPVLSADGKVLAYFAGKGAKNFVVVNGKAGEEFDSVRGSLVGQPPMISADGTVVVYHAANGTKRMIVIGDKKYDEFDLISQFAFSPAGHAWAFSSTKGNDKYFVDGGGKHGPYQWVGPIEFSPDGKRLACTATSKGQPMTLIVDGKDTDKATSIHDVAFLADGTLTYRKRDGTKQFLVIGSKSVEMKDPAVVDVKGGLLAKVVRDGKKVCVVQGESKGELYDEISDLTPNAARTALAYAANIGKRLTGGPDGPPAPGKWHVVAGGKQGGEFDSVMDLRLGSDGVTAFYRGRQNGQWRVMIGEEPGDLFSRVDSFILSPDGSTVAYAAMTDLTTAYIGVGTHRGEAFTQVWTPVFTPDGKKVCFAARKVFEVWWKVRDVPKP